MANNDDTLFREIDEELRRERAQELWNRYGTYFIVAALALVIGVWGARFYMDRKAAAAAAAGAAFDQAIALAEANKPAEAIASFEQLVKSGPSGYAALARLQIAAAHAKAGDKAKAAAALQALADDTSADQTLRSLAALQLAMLKVGDGDFTAVENRLNDLAADTSPWKANARELLAVAALKAGRSDAARATLEQLLGDPATPAGVRSRAQMLLGGIVAKDVASASPGAADGASK